MMPEYLNNTQMSHPADRLYAGKWGVFTHYLYGIQNAPGNTANMGAGETDWNSCVNSLDIEAMAYSLSKARIGYYFITVMQGRKYMIAPNSTFDRITGNSPGEACSFRDVVEELYAALSKYGIDLYLYFTGDGPCRDYSEARRFGFVLPESGHAQIQRDFVLKWASVLAEYSLRYKDKVSGWWIDGCYREYSGYGYDDSLLKLLYDACKAGNPDSLVAMNNGVFPELRKNYMYEEFTCGEFNDFTYIPKTRFVDGAQAHILAPLGEPPKGAGYGDVWSKPGIKRTKEYMLEYIMSVNKTGGVVTIDAMLCRDGSFDEKQIELLKYIGRNLYRASSL